MKLLDKTNIYFFGVSLLIFCIGGVLFFILFKIIIDIDQNQKLQLRKEYTIKQLMKSDSLEFYQKYSANMVFIRPVPKFNDSTERFSDTTIFDNIDLQNVAYRKLSLNVTIKGKSYRIEMRRALVEMTRLIEGVVILVLILFTAFVAILSLVNNRLSKAIWKPFYQILDRINTYRIDRAESLSFPESSIEEFNILSVDIEKMTYKIHQEFNIQKEFIENASHEIQTPLSIINSKLEILLQTPQLASEQLDLINSSLIAVKRLSKLNEALLILSRIENRQFHYTEEININTALDRHLENLEELIQINNISITKEYLDKIRVTMNPFLADILLENLITNAIRHNVTGGSIIIRTEMEGLTISNTGAEPSGDPGTLFQRFVKVNKKSNSLGLGLSIVKGISDTYRFIIDYTFVNPMHRISLRINPSNSFPAK